MSTPNPLAAVLELRDLFQKSRKLIFINKKPVEKNPPVL